MSNPTDKEIAAKVTAAAKALMEAINAAYEIGLEVSVKGVALEGWGRFEPAGISEYRASKAVRVFRTHVLNHVDGRRTDEAVQDMADGRRTPNDVRADSGRDAI